MSENELIAWFIVGVIVGWFMFGFSMLVGMPTKFIIVYENVTWCKEPSIGMFPTYNPIEGGNLSSCRTASDCANINHTLEGCNNIDCNWQCCDSHGFCTQTLLECHYEQKPSAIPHPLGVGQGRQEMT
jgi:hypothetical protein